MMAAARPAGFSASMFTPKRNRTPSATLRLEESSRRRRADMNSRIDRRVMIGATFSLFAADALAQRRGRDRGIGGTGVFSEPDDGDRGIGGTGVIGTIRKFGSIIVNGMRIAYPASPKSKSTDASPTPKDLRLGQVVQYCRQNPQSRPGHRPHHRHQRSGRSDRSHGARPPCRPRPERRHRLCRRPETQDWAMDRRERIARPQWRDPRQPHPAPRRFLAQVAGPVTVRNGVAQIGELPLVNLDAGLEGRRVLAEVGKTQRPAGGRHRDARPRACGDAERPSSVDRNLCRARRRRIAHGLGPHRRRRAGPGRRADPTAPERAVVTATVNPDGSMTATALRQAADPDTAPAPDRQPANSAQQGKSTSSDKPANQDAASDPDKDKKSSRDQTPAKSAPVTAPQPAPSTPSTNEPVDSSRNRRR